MINYKQIAQTKVMKAMRLRIAHEGVKNYFLETSVLNFGLCN